MKNSFFKENLGKIIVSFFGILIIIITLTITFFLFFKGTKTFTVHRHSVFEFLFNSLWDPSKNAGRGGGSIGSSIFIAGSIEVSLLALLLATPLSIAAALFITEISPKIGSRFLKPAIEIFVGIPSVVYGWVGITVLCPFIAKTFHLVFGGESVLAAGLVLALMIFPTISSVATDSLCGVAPKLKEASYALGSTRSQMMRRVGLPAAAPGIFTGIILGLARAFGEALAVSMVIGGRFSFAKNILSQTSTLTTQIASAMGSAVDGTEWIDSLWSMALLLFVISFVFILIMRLLSTFSKKSGKN